jgi:hypothetical protein
MPYKCARAVCATFCYKIAGALIPIFGPDFPSQCIPPQTSEYGRMIINPQTIADAKRDAELSRRLYINSSISPDVNGFIGNFRPERNTLKASPNDRRHLRLDTRLGRTHTYNKSKPYGNHHHSAPPSASTPISSPVPASHPYPAIGQIRSNPIIWPTQAHPGLEQVYHLGSSYHRPNPMLSAIPSSSPTSGYSALPSTPYTFTSAPVAKRSIETDEHRSRYDGSETPSTDSPIIEYLRDHRQDGHLTEEMAQQKAAMLLMNICVQEPSPRCAGAIEPMNQDLQRRKRRRTTSV